MIALPLLLVAPATRPVALTYHDVTLRKSVWFDCTPAEFRAQLDAMTKAGVHFVSLRQVEAWYHGAPLPPRAVAITFADNYRGFLTYAYPLLKARGISVAMFVHTGFVGSPVGRPKMTWDDLRRLDAEGLVTIGSQTVTHRSLSALPSKVIGSELTSSRRDLQKHLRQPIRYLAYPNGAYDGRCEAAAKAAGYALAFGEVTRPFGHDPYAVERYVHTKWRQALRDGRIASR